MVHGRALVLVVRHRDQHEDERRVVLALREPHDLHAVVDALVAHDESREGLVERDGSLEIAHPQRDMRQPGSHALTIRRRAAEWNEAYGGGRVYPARRRSRALA